MARRGEQPPGPVSRPRSLAARVSRLRLHDWGKLSQRRLQRLAYFLKLLRERAGESMEELSQAAVADGAPASGRTIWYIEAMTDGAVAAKRERINLLLVAYVLERYGSTLDELWSFMTAEESWQGAEGGTGAGGAADVRAEARALGDLYAFLAQADPHRARQLLDFAQFTLEQSEREADDRQGGHDQGEASAVRGALLEETRREIEAASGEGDEEDEGRRRRSS